MRKSVVELFRQATKDIKKIPRTILVLFDFWVTLVETSGYGEMKKRPVHKDHDLKGKRRGQRSVYLNGSYRVIYELKEGSSLEIIEVQEVNKHEY